jgi:hypothetical protein
MAEDAPHRIVVTDDEGRRECLACGIWWDPEETILVECDWLALLALAERERDEARAEAAKWQADAKRLSDAVTAWQIHSASRAAPQPRNGQPEEGP